MTDKLISISEAVERGISELRRDPWEPSSRLVLHLTQSEGRWTYGPWAKLVDACDDAGIRGPGKPMRETPPVFVLNLDANEKAWEPWVRSTQ